MRSRLYLVLVAGALAACGSNKPPETPQTSPPPDKPKPGLQVQGELGVLDVSKVDETFAKVKDDLQKCLDKGNKFAAGNVLYALRINHSGQVRWAFLKDSTVGDREAETCMLEVLKAARWPAPDGGEDGLAEKPFEFPDREERPPVDWEPDQVRSAVDGARAKFAKCRQGNKGVFRATAIVQTNGSVASAGVSPPDEKGEEASDCIVDVIKKLKLPKTGSWPAKVTFEVP